MSLHFRPDLLRVDVADDVTLVRLTTARFEDGNVESIGQELADLVDRLGRHRLHLDLGEVQFVSSVGLAKLLALNRKVRAVGGEFRLCNVRPEVYQIFEATRLTRLLDIRR
jgi:anti-anti-sigma factor